MAVILNIDTATEVASASISREENVIDFITNNNQKDHASFLQPAIKVLLQRTGIAISELNAVALTAGPGSYTGLRVGMASAKGLCYALNIPLISIGTLEVMAWSAIKKVQDVDALYCPMIDARRMEVFTAIYNYNLTEVIAPCSMILNNESFQQHLHTRKIYFSGNGAAKLKELIKENADYIDDELVNLDSLAQLAVKYYHNKQFSDIYYSTPIYLKEFYTPK